ncbi:NADP-dependent oxidoreductase [Curtobacterium sp. MCBD17_019]|uniref:NADP-dependent oxidoreductase n=1 Tax=Curtobacterium sp. MCBD17_019 TaxID=2175669 RepID=UPI001C65105E|nr:NADP-dependent oxidoreductase [Curtobacterium sp. MCBD17_019]
MTDTMRTLRFHEYGEPEAVLRFETAPVPEPGSGRIRVRVRAAGLAPADWALCGGLFAGSLPRGVGCDVAGTVDAVGDGVVGVSVGDVVFGTADWANSPSAGASDWAVMNRWFPVPEGLDLVQAAALPMTVDTAYAHLRWLGLEPGKTILVHGAGSTIGFAAVQIALLRGMHVIATAGETYAKQLRDLGAIVTSYGDGMVGRVAELADGPVDVALDTAPVGGALPDLIRIVGGDPRRVLTISDFAAAAELGTRSSATEDLTDRVEALPEFAALAAEGHFRVPVAATFPLEDWQTALTISRSGNARGKLVLLPKGADAAS